jgi:hypothetical protein
MQSFMLKRTEEKDAEVGVPPLIHSSGPFQFRDADRL